LEKKERVRSYTQVFAPSTSKILKIKEAFPKLQVNKIDNIHKIINNLEKTKPKLNMMIKGSFRKQVIVLISIKNKNKFMESSSSHITNLNRILKSIKSEVMVNFVCSDLIGITIVTNKVATPLCYELRSLELDKRTTFVLEKYKRTQ